MANFESVLGPLTLSAPTTTASCAKRASVRVTGCRSLRACCHRTLRAVSFEEGELLHELAGADVPTKHVERAAEALGVRSPRTRSSWSSRRSKRITGANAIPWDGWYRCASAQKGVGRSAGQAARRLVQDARGQARHDLERRGTGQRRHARARRRLDQLLGCYRKCSAQKDTDATPSEFAARVEREATRRGFERAARQAVLGDGAIWIWNLTDEHFPDAVQIVDRFHAKQTSRTCPSPSMAPALTSHSSGRATP